jgi:phage gp16-like protein
MAGPRPADEEGEGRKMKSARHNMLAKIHLAKRDLGLSDVDYRHVLFVQFGVDSSAKLSDLELHKLLDHFRSKGWGQKRSADPKRGRDFKPPVRADREGLIGKIEAQLAELGRHQGRRVPWAYAESILRRQTGNPNAYLNWATAEQLEKVVQALY